MNTRTTIILLIVALALGGGVLFMLNQEQKAAERETTSAAISKDLFSPKPADAVQLRIEQADTAPLAMELRNDDWFLTEPIKAPAKKYAVTDQIRYASDLQYVQKYEHGSADMPADDLTGLKTPNMVIILKEKDGKTRSLKIGNLRPLGSETYVAIDNDPAVYVVKLNLLQRFGRALKEYRESRVTQLVSTDATRISVQGLQNHEFVKADAKWVLDKPVHSRADQTKVQDLVRAVTDLSTDNFVADNPTNLRIYGLAQPQLKLTVTTEKMPPASQPAGTQPATQPAATQPVETKTATLLVGAKSGSQYFAMIEGEPSVFQIPEATFKNLNVALTDLRDKAVAGVEAEKVDTLDVESAGRTVRLARNVNHHWLMTGAYTGKADLSAVDDLLKAITKAQAAAFEDDPKQLTSYGFEKPRARVQLTASGQVAPVELLIGANTPSGEMTFVKNLGEGTVAVLKKSDAEAMIVEPNTLLDRSITTFSADDIQKMEITRNNSKSALVRGEDRNWRLAEPVAAPADKDAIQAIVADLSNLRARKVVAAGDGADYGLNEPTAAITVYVQDRSAAGKPASTQAAESQPAQPTEKAHTLLVARNAKDGQVYARLEDREWIYQLDPVVHVHLGAELHDRTMLSFDAEQVAAIKVPGDKDETLEFSKQDGKWTYLADPYLQIDPAKVKEYLTLLHDARAERFIAYNVCSDADYGLDQPLCQAEITLDSGKALKMIIAKATDTGKFVATVAGTTAVVELPAGLVQQLRKSLAFFKGQ